MEAGGLGPWLRGLRFWEGSHRIPPEGEKKQPAAAALLASEEGPGSKPTLEGPSTAPQPGGTAATAPSRAQDGTGSARHGTVLPPLTGAPDNGHPRPGGSRAGGGQAGAPSRAGLLRPALPRPRESPRAPPCRWQHLPASHNQRASSCQADLARTCVASSRAFAVSSEPLGSGWEQLLPVWESPRVALQQPPKTGRYPTTAPAPRAAETRQQRPARVRGCSPQPGEAGAHGSGATAVPHTERSPGRAPGAGAGSRVAGKELSGEAIWCEEKPFPAAPAVLLNTLQNVLMQPPFPGGV